MSNSCNVPGERNLTKKSELEEDAKENSKNADL